MAGALGINLSIKVGSLIVRVLQSFNLLTESGDDLITEAGNYIQLEG